MSLRLAWFTHRYAPCLGGAETYARAMVRRFVAAGHAVEVFTSDADDLRYFARPGPGRVDAPAESVVDGAQVRRFAVRHYPAQRYVNRLLSYLPHWPTRCRYDSFMPILPGLDCVREPFDAVFALGFPFTLFPYAALLAARACGAPLVLTPFLHLATPGDPLRRVYTRPHQRRLLREADLVVSPTRLETEFLASWGIPASRRLVLPMAIDPETVTGGDGPGFRARLGIARDAAVVGQLGALDPNKGTNDLLGALVEVNRLRPEDRPVHLVLAGKPSPAFLEALAALGTPSPPWLHMLGPIPDNDVPGFYQAVDVFAMPSRTDSFGIVFLEAWANGRPVVAAAAGGVVEVVRHGEDGLLVPFGDRTALREAIGRLVDDSGLARRLGASGAERMARDGQWDSRFELLWGRLQELLPRERPRFSGRTARRRVPHP